MAFLTTLMQMKQPVLTDKNGISIIESIFKIIILVLGTWLHFKTFSFLDDTVQSIMVGPVFTDCIHNTIYLLTMSWLIVRHKGISS